MVVMVMAATVLLQRQKLVKSASFQFKNSSRQKRIENMLLMSGIWRQKVTGRSNLSSSSIPPSFPILFKKRTTAPLLFIFILYFPQSSQQQQQHPRDPHYNGQLVIRLPVIFSDVYTGANYMLLNSPPFFLMLT